MSQYDVGIQEDFNNMTHELGRTITIESRDRTLGYDTEEWPATPPFPFGVPPSGIGFPILFERLSQFEEIAFIQPLKAEHEVVRAGELDIGDIKCVFKSDSQIAEEDLIYYGTDVFKIQKVTIVRGMSNDSIVYIKAYGKRVADR